MKNLYEYDYETKELIGELVQYIDPLETKKAGKDIYIKVSNATSAKPLQKKEGFLIKFDGKKWFYEEIPKEKIQKEEDYTPTKEDREEADFQEWKDKKLREIYKAEMEEVENTK